MAWDRTERRSTELRAPLPAGFRRPAQDERTQRAAPQIRLFDAETGFYTMPALAEFIQYEIDGSAQTLRNELYITPLCVAAIAVGLPLGVKDEMQHDRFLAAVSEAARGVTRVADRVAREGDRLIALLRRTMANNLRDCYAPRLTKYVEEACAEWGKVTVSIGISSLVEHVAKSPEHMVRMAQRALDEALKTPGGAVVYDFRVMPLD